MILSIIGLWYLFILLLIVGKGVVDEYSKVRLVGFNPIYKRVVAEFTHPSKGKITIAKGLPAKVLDTAGRHDVISFPIPYETQFFTFPIIYLCNKFDRWR